MRPIAAIGFLALALALGVLTVGHGLVLPMLEQGTDLLDANLGHSVGHGVASRLGMVLLGACVVLCVTVGRWTRSRWATTLALFSVVLAAVDQLVLMPRVYRAWTLVDLVSLRPLDRLEQAASLARSHDGVLMAIGALLLVVAALALSSAGGQAAGAEPNTVPAT